MMNNITTYTIKVKTCSWWDNAGSVNTLCLKCSTSLSISTILFVVLVSFMSVISWYAAMSSSTIFPISRTGAVVFTKPLMNPCISVDDIIMLLLIFFFLNCDKKKKWSFDIVISISWWTLQNKQSFENMLLYLLFMCGVGTIVADVFPGIRDITPYRFEKNFGNEITVHSMNVTLTTVVSNSTIMLFSGPIYEPFDRLPPVSAWRYCTNNKGMIVQDHGRIEKYIYSCCGTSNNGYHHICPVPPAPLPDIFRALPRIDSYTVYGKLVGPDDEWVQTSNVLVYYDRNDVIGFVKRFIACVVIGVIVLGGIVHVMEAINTFSNKWPMIFLYLHLLMTIFIVLIEWAILSYMQPSYVRAGIAHSLFHTIFSPFIVYIPGAIKGRDQRITIHSHSTYLTDLLECSKHPYTRYTIFVIYIGAMLLQGLSVYALVNVLWETFDASFEVMVGLGIGYLLVTLVYTVAFITGLYNLHIPLRIGHDIEATYNHRIRRIGTEHGTVQKIGMYQPSTRMFVPISRSTLTTGDCVAMDNGNRVFSVLCWKLDNIRPDSYTMCGRRVTVPSRASNDDLSVYRVNARHDLERIGIIRNNAIFHHEHAILLRVFQWLLKFAPVFDESEGDYQLNIIELLREEMQRLTQPYVLCNQSVYGIVYWLAFVAMVCVNTWTLGRDLWSHVVQTYHGSWWVYAYDMCVAVILIVFVINVATRREFVPMGKKRGRKVQTTVLKYDGDKTLCLVENRSSIAVSGSLTEIRTGDGKNLSPTCIHCHPLIARLTQHDRYVCDIPTCESPRLPIYAQVWYCESCNWCRCARCTDPIVCDPGNIYLSGTGSVNVTDI